MECEKWELAWPEQRRARAKTKAKEEECENQEEETVETESNVPPPVIKATFSMPIVFDGVFLSLTFPLFNKFPAGPQLLLSNILLPRLLQVC